MSRDNSSYFDYGNKFSKFIKNNETVATYGLWGFYYADFNYIYSEDVFRKIGRSLSLLSKNGATKLLIKGGDMAWFCKTENLVDCSKHNYVFLTSYVFSDLSASQYLYAFK